MSKSIFNGRERRGYVRIDTQLPVRFRIYSLFSGKIFLGETKNVSQSGLCVEASQDQDELIETLSSLEPLPTIEVALSLPDLHGEPTIQVDWITGRLDWAKKPNAKDPTLLIGVGFVDMEKKVRRQLHEFVVGQFLKRYHPQQRVRPPA